MAEQPQSLDSISLIRRKKGGEGDRPEVPAVRQEPLQAIEPDVLEEHVPDTSMRMKPRETVQLTAVHVRIPEQIARGLRLMSVLEGRQAQELAAEAFETMLTAWNVNWRASVPPKR